MGIEETFDNQGLCLVFGHHRERLLEICRAAYQDRVKTDTDVPSYRRVESLAHPGGNITGISAAGAEMAGKRLELLRQLIPNLSRVAVLASDSTTNPFIPLFVRETTTVAKLGTSVSVLTRSW
jgi:hypothetical protein